jgi:hypothetical protein
MDDTGPQAVHFAWEDIMEYKTFKAPKHGRKPTRHLSLSEYPSSDGEPTDSDVDTSQWSETESNISTGRSSVAGSHSTRTTFSLSGVDDFCGDEEQIDFPSYDDADLSGRRVSDLCDDFSSFPSISPTEDPESSSPEAIEHAEDDVAISATPWRHVDYLSHDWCEEDIWSSWKHLRSKKKVYSKKERLENAAWRIWGKERQNLDTTTPESISWYVCRDHPPYHVLTYLRNKDRDVTWLYGPFQTVAKEIDLCYTSGATVSAVHSSSFYVKPILKKRTLSETLLQRSISASSLVKQAATTTLRSEDQNPEEEPLQLTPSEPTKKTVRFSSTRTGSDQNVSTPAKNVRFHEKVEQYIAVENGDHEEPENENELEDCLTMYYSQTEPAKVKLYNKSSSLSNKSAQKSTSNAPESAVKIVSSLPTTALKDAKDTKPHSLSAAKKSAWSPCSYFYDASKGTVRTLEPGSIRAAYDGDDKEDYLETFASPNVPAASVSGQGHDRTSDMTSGGELTKAPLGISSYDQIQSQEVSGARARSDSEVKSPVKASKQHVNEPQDILSPQPPFNITTVIKNGVNTSEADVSVSEKGFTGTDSDLDSDTQSTSEDYSVESDDTSSGSSGYGSLSDLDAERRSYGNAIGFILDPIRQGLVDRVMEEFWTLFDQDLDSNIITCNINSPNSSTAASISTPSSAVPSKQVQRKRQRIDDDEEPEDNEDRKGRQPRRLPASKGEGDGTSTTIEYALCLTGSR